MKPTKASHAVPLPPRPLTAPAAAGYPPLPSGAPPVPTPVRGGSRAELTVGTAAPDVLPVSVAALATPTRRGVGVVPLGVEVTSSGSWGTGSLATPKNSDRHGANGQMRIMMPRSSHSIRQNVMQASASGTPSRCITPPELEAAEDLATCQAGILPTPKNSERGSSGCMRVMMPRSSRSIRHSVVQARGCEQADIVTDLVPQASAAVSCGTPSRRVGTPTPLGEEVVHSTVGWDSGPLATPKNGERRDLNGSVQLMAPLWRGSAATPLAGEQAHPAPVQPPSPTAAVPVPAAAAPPLRRPPTQLGSEVMQSVAPVATGTPMRRSPTPLSVEVSNTQMGSWMSVATPKNSDRRDLNGSMQLNAPLWRGSAGTPVAGELQVVAS